jgi:hypothetical protein
MLPRNGFWPGTLAEPLPPRHPMRILEAMTAQGDTDRNDGPTEDEPKQEQREGRSASQDLADGLELVMRAARKAMRDIDTGRIEELGRRARQNLERIDRRKVEELGRMAAQKLDPRRIEEIAEDAGRELLKVVERVADRVESVVGNRRSSPPPRSEEQSESTGADPDSAQSEAGSEEAKARVRIEDE